MACAVDVVATRPTIQTGSRTSENVHGGDDNRENRWNSGQELVVYIHRRPLPFGGSQTLVEHIWGHLELGDEECPRASDQNLGAKRRAAQKAARLASPEQQRFM